MDPWHGKAIVLIAAGGLGLIRAAHGLRKRRRTVTARRESWPQMLVLPATVAGFIVPIAWATSPWLASADVAAHPALVVAGGVMLSAGLWLFHRAHADLGTNWSMRLELLESHELITRGVYRRVRHPMYLALLLYGFGEALVVPNWIAGPSCLAGVALLVASRLGPEEAMMRERFGRGYDAYRARTGGLMPRFRRRP